MTPIIRACSSMVRAPSLYLGGSWFESRHAHVNNFSVDRAGGKNYSKSITQQIEYMIGCKKRVEQPLERKGQGFGSEPPVYS